MPRGDTHESYPITAISISRWLAAGHAVDELEYVNTGLLGSHRRQTDRHVFVLHEFLDI
jgi:hypothetical protein